VVAAEVAAEVAEVVVGLPPVAPADAVLLELEQPTMSALTVKAPTPATKSRCVVGLLTPVS
jgi:hypothetical protein